MTESTIRLASVDEVMATYAITSSPVKRIVFLSLGLIFVVFAIIGIWVPVSYTHLTLPTIE